MTSLQRLALTVSFLLIVAPFAARPAPLDEDPEPPLTDPFDGKFRRAWKIVRPDDKHWSLTKNKGKLTITTQRGSIHGTTDEKNRAKNFFLLNNPYDRKSDFVVSVCVSDFAPAASYNQGGLLLYDDDDNYIKFTCEYNSSKPGNVILVMMRETDATPEHKTADPPANAKKVWLRLTKRGDKYEYASSGDGKKWTAHHEWEWGKRGPARIGILAKNGGTDAPEIDVCFQDFQLRPGAATQAKPK